MPFSTAQVSRILDPDLIPKSRVSSLPARVVESWMRRRLFVIEDQLIADQLRQFKQSGRAIREMASDVAEFNGVGSKLDNGPASRRWRDTVLERAEPILTNTYRVMAMEAAEWATQAYAAGFYGRLWLLDENTTDDAPLNVPRITPQQATRAVLLDEQLGTTFDPLIYSLLGTEWRGQYQIELDDLILRIRRALNRGLREGLGERETMRIVSSAMGISTDRRSGFRANFNRVQAITRTVFNTAANAGAFAAYDANRDVLSGVEWLTARDERVCVICQRLDGKVWRFDDPNREQPPAHVNCRCGIIPVIKPDWQRTAGELRNPPRNTFADFLVTFALQQVLEPFLSGRKIESERV